MLPNVSRGFSFKGLTAYLMGDKREGEAAPDMAGIEPDGPGERVGFAEVLNFTGDEARDPYEAAKIMALVVRDADQIKAAAGVKATGRKAEGPPVWHASLSWHGSEKPDRAEMMRAVDSSLDAVGLALDKGYQTVVIQHTDTAHPHVHVVVNLVHPLTGKQANPYRDQQKAQAWANRYEKERGHVFCEDRAAKYAGIEQAKAAGEKGKRPWMSRDQWQARVREGKDGAAALKADLAQRYAALKRANEAAFARRGREMAAFHADRRQQRDAIREKYRQALDAVWQSPQRLIDNRAAGQGRDFSHLAKGAVRAAAKLDARRRAFERREATALGRLSNAIRVAGKDASFGRVLMLAVLTGERRQAFESQLRREQYRQMPPAQHALPRRANVETKGQRAAEIKQRRGAELAAFDGKTAWQAAQMRDRHERERTAEREQRQQLGREAETRWQQHREAFGWTSPNRAKFREATRTPRDPQQAARRDNARADARFRAQSAGIEARQGQRTEGQGQGQAEFRRAGYSAAQWRQHTSQQEAKEDRERAERQQTTPDASEAFQRQATGQESPSETKPAPASAEAGHERPSWTAEDLARFQQIKADRAAERAAPSQEHDPGRTL